jgi:uncharacterized membrane protein YfcA
MPDPVTVTIVAATFLLAGLVKGVIGLGLPTIGLALLTAALGLPQAMALLLAPSLVTNLWQAAVGGHARAILARLWPFLVLAGATVWLGAEALAKVEVAWLSALLGLLLAVYALAGLSGLRFAVRRERERWLGPLLGAINGVLTGMTGSFVVPGVLYLQALGLPRDQLVQAMGIFFTVSTAALALALGGHGLLTAELGLLSAAAVLPALLGMALGQRLRRRLSERRFRQVFLLALLALGAWLALRSLA